MKRLLIGLGITLSVGLAVGFVFANFFPHILFIYWARYDLPKKQYGLLYEKPIERSLIKSGANGSVATHT